MRKYLFTLVIIVSFLFNSCNPDILNHKGQKVITLIVGLDYAKRETSLDSLKFKIGTDLYTVGELNASVRDAKEVGAALDSVYNNKEIEHSVIFMLSEGESPDYNDKYYPSSGNIINKIKNLGLDKDDLFVFYFAGHGYFSGSEMYLLTGDTSSSNNVCTSITSTNLLSTIRSLPCRSVIILDSCFSGVADPGNSPSSETFVYSVKNMLKEKFNIESETKLSVLCASKWNEESNEGYFIETENGKIEEHGQFTGRLLNVLGWKHSNEKNTVVNDNSGNKVIADGESMGIKGSLSLDEIFSKILDGWTFPNMRHHPVFYYTNESINLIPTN